MLIFSQRSLGKHPDAPRARGYAYAALAFVCVLGVLCPSFCEKVMIYDEEKGIIFVDKDEAGNPKKPEKQEKPEKQPEREAVERPAVRRAPAPGTLQTAKNVDNSFIRGKKKDPSGVYFESGLQYFKTGNYDDALRQFIHADSTDPQPVYSLWIGKTYRQLGKGDQVLFIMKRILDTYPDSAVAADALFETGFYYQTADDYAKAASIYTQLTEQYPFSKSYSNGEEFREVAKRLKQIMRSDMVTALKVLGYDGDEPEDLYRSFQKAKGLPVTGQGDQKTVRAVKQEFRQFQIDEKKKAAAQVRAERTMKWSAGLAGLCVLCMTVMLFIRSAAQKRKKHLAALSQSLNDIDLRKI
jgi:tetratricopeptide (TPR) repeat protein